VVVRNNVLSRVTLAGRVKLRDPAIPNDTGVAALDSDYNLYLASTPPAAPWPTEPHALSAQSRCSPRLSSFQRQARSP
jgi:hypothetical protein